MNSYLTLREIQLSELAILKRFDAFARTYHISYFALDGTLLGAVRHQGFIPWDDDIDIGLLRPEYEKLVSVLKEKKCRLDGSLSGIGFELGNDQWPFLKIIDRSVLVNEPSGMNRYLWIDVFPVDGIPEDPAFFRKVIRKRRLFLWKRMRNSPAGGYRKAIARFLLAPFSEEKILRKYIGFCASFPVKDSKYAYNVVWGENGGSKYPTESVLKNMSLPFEDMEIPAPAEYEEMLKRTYGDYRILPAEEKRKTHCFQAWRVVGEDTAEK